MKKRMKKMPWLLLIGFVLFIIGLALSLFAMRAAQSKIAAHSFYVISDRAAESETLAPSLTLKSREVLENGDRMIVLQAAPYSAIHSYRLIEAAFGDGAEIYDGEVYLTMLAQKVRFVSMLLVISLLALGLTYLRRRLRIFSMQMKKVFARHYAKSVLKRYAWRILLELTLWGAWFSLFWLTLYALPFEPVFKMPYAGVYEQIRQFVMGDGFMPAQVPGLREPFLELSQGGFYMGGGGFTLIAAYLLLLDKRDDRNLNRCFL